MTNPAGAYAYILGHCHCTPLISASKLASRTIHTPVIRLSMSAQRYMRMRTGGFLTARMSTGGSAPRHQLAYPKASTALLKNHTHEERRAFLQDRVQEISNFPESELSPGKVLTSKMLTVVDGRPADYCERSFSKHTTIFAVHIVFSLYDPIRVCPQGKG